MRFRVESLKFRFSNSPVYAFLLLTVIAGAVSLFLLKKVDVAVSEIESLQTSPVFVARKEFAVGTEPANIAGWRTYRNEEYGFELQYPADFEEKKSSVEFGAAGGWSYREVYVNVIPPVASFREYLDGLALTRARGIREGRLTVFEKGSVEVAARQGLREELYDNPISSFTVRTFVDFTPRAIISVTVRESGALGDAKEVPTALKALSEKVISTFRRAP